jgi:hypothetical protein
MKNSILLFLALISLNSFAQESALLRLNYSEGDQYQMRVVTVQSGAMMNMTITMEMEMDVKEANDQEFKTETKISAVELNAFQAGMNINYNSKNKEQATDPMSEQMAQQFEPMMKSVIHSTVNSLGKVSDIKIVPPVNGLDQNTMNRNSITYPEKEVKVGDSWNSGEETDGMKVSSTYTVTKIENGLVFIEITGEVSGVTSGKVSGKAQIEISSGVQKESELEMTMAVQGMDIKVIIKTTMTKK